VLYNKAVKGNGLKTSYPKPDQPASGDLTTWVGKSPAGKWTLQVIDSGFLNNTLDGKINGWSIAVGTLSSKKVQVKGALGVDGTLAVTGNTTLGGVVNATDTLQVGGQAVNSNFKFTLINNDFRNNSGTVAANTWGDIPARTLLYNKTRDASVLRITYADTLGTLGTNYSQCNWRILVDGASYAQFSAADITFGLAWRMQTASHMALAANLKAGPHTIKVQTYRATGASECLMGWNTAGNFLAAEEVGP
jgi:hypothetical protein